MKVLDLDNEDQNTKHQVFDSYGQLVMLNKFKKKNLSCTCTYHIGAL